jgi:hypothetical protein
MRRCGLELGHDALEFVERSAHPLAILLCEFGTLRSENA